MYPIDLSGKNAIIFGVANDRSIAWHVAEALHKAGARLAIAYQNERLLSRVQRLTQDIPNTLLLECDVSTDAAIEAVFQKAASELGSLHAMVHSIAFAQREDLEGDFSKTSRGGFQKALEISAYSLIPLVRHAAPLMKDGGSVVTLTFEASQRVYPGYNVMGAAKAALENEVRQLAYEFGPRSIRVNAVSAGPLETLAARGIHGFLDMKKVHAERAPLQRNITHDEVGKAALFLLSDLASGVTGAVLPVDAGYHIMGV
ncbi:MAG: enoyl-ACP reductase [SAR202 cluster bacterium]|nr:enoyl-ACP reductase [SAR202 cluster bacterium]